VWATTLFGAERDETGAPDLPAVEKQARRRLNGLNTKRETTFSVEASPVGGTIVVDWVLATGIDQFLIAKF
jgi:hypothetical protein